MNQSFENSNTYIMDRIYIAVILGYTTVSNLSAIFPSLHSLFGSEDMTEEQDTCPCPPNMSSDSKEKC